MEKSKLQALLSDMSLQEKILQLVQLPGSIYKKDGAWTGLSDNDGITEDVIYQAGSTLSIYGAEDLIEIQKKYMEKQPHHIPLLFMLDVIHGHKTVFPAPLAQGATFDPELTRKGAEIAAKECSADGVHVTFSPMADLARDARWGRVVESTGEDPYLNGKMTAAMVQGFQGTEDFDAPIDTDHVAACVKHFAAYSGAVGGRDYNIVEASMSMLRDQYFPAYEQGIKAGAKLVMTSFNTLDGIPSTGNKWLMRDVLRRDMGFRGTLISDWGAVGELVPWGVAEDLKQAAELAIKAGCDIEMCTGAYYGSLEQLVAEGRVDINLIDEAVMRILNLKNDLGLFEDPYHGASASKAKEIFLSQKSRDAARKAVRESLVLLKNEDNILPLIQEKRINSAPKSKRIAFIGPYIEDADLRSSWSVSTDDSANVSIKTAAQEAFADTDCEISFAKGCTMLDNDTVLGIKVYHNDNYEEDNEKLLTEALRLAADADTIVLCLGEDMGQSGESTSRAHIEIPEIQKKLMRAVASVNQNIVTLLFNGRPLEVQEIADKSKALLECWRPGTEGGHGILDVLTGEIAPSGKLPISFPYSVGQEPLYYNHFSTGRPKPTEGPTYFTTRYLDVPNEALYPFGYGLSYTTFQYSPVELDKDVLIKPVDDTETDLANEKEINTPDIVTSGSNKITASVTVTNTGNTAATEVVQMYIRDLASSRIRPVRELKGFERVTLAPGQSQSVSFTITEDQLRFWTGEKFESETGKFKVFIGGSSTIENGAEFELT